MSTNFLVIADFLRHFNSSAILTRVPFLSNTGATHVTLGTSRAPTDDASRNDGTATTTETVGMAAMKSIVVG